MIIIIVNYEQFSSLHLINFVGREVHIPWYAALNEPCGGVVTLEVIFGKTLDTRGRLFASDIIKSIFVEIIS